MKKISLLFTAFFIVITMKNVFAQEKIYYPGEGYFVPTAKSQGTGDDILHIPAYLKDIRANEKSIVVRPVITHFPYILLSTEVYDESNQMVKNLSADDFTVTEMVAPDTTPETMTISCFSESLTINGISFALVFDTSASMDNARLADAKAAVNQFISRCSANDQGALVTFSSGGTEKIVEPLGWVGNDNNNNKIRDLADAVNSLTAQGTTAVFDAMAKGMDSLAQAPNPKVVILFSDGLTNSDKLYNLNQVIDRADQEQIVLYTIGLGIDSQNLKDMAVGTGGAYYFSPNAGDMVTIYSEIYNNFAGLIKKQYHIMYKSHNPAADGKTHNYSVTYLDETVSGSYTANYPPKIDLDAGSSSLGEQSQPPNVSLTVSGIISDSNATLLNQTMVAVLNYKNISEATYHQSPLTLSRDSSGRLAFSVVIAASQVVEPGIEYYLQVNDGIDTTYLPVNYALLPYVIPVLPYRAPDIVHAPVTAAKSNQAITINADALVSDAGRTISQVLLYYRLREPNLESDYSAVAMLSDDQKIYMTVVPASQVTASGIDYFISAVDSAGIRKEDGHADAPHVIVVDGNATSKPVADAGADQTVQAGAVVTLDGYLSFDPDPNETLQYFWEQIQGSTLTLSSQSEAQAVYTTPSSVGGSTIAVFQLRVTDSTCLQSFDTVYITIEDPPPSAAFAWSPNPASQNTTITFTDQSSTLANEITSWAWDFGGLGQSSSRNPTFTFTDSGSYPVSLTVTDSNGFVSTRNETVTVYGNAPVASAGQDQNVIEGTVVTLDGSTSYDPDSDESLTYQWTQVSGPNVTLSDFNAVRPTFTAPAVEDQAIEIVFQLTTTDSDGLQSVDSVTITIQDRSSAAEDCDANAGCFIATVAGNQTSEIDSTKQIFFWGLIWSVLIIILFKVVSGFKMIPKKQNVFFTFLFLMLFVLVPNSNAEIKAKAVSITPYAGGYMFDEEQHIDVGPMAGIGFEYHLDSNWGLELKGSLGPSVYNFPEPTTCLCKEEDVFGTWVDLNGTYHLWPKKVFVPYLSAGVGYGELKFYTLDDYSSTYVNYGGGADYFLTDSISLRGDARHIYNFEDANNNLSIWVGVRFQIGPKVKKAVEPIAVAPEPKPEPEPQVEKTLPAEVSAAPIIEKPKAVPPKPPEVPEPPKFKPVNIYIKFGLNQTAIQAEYQKELDKVSALLKGNPDIRVTIEGHTCSLGAASYNLKLSQKRADAAKNYLVDTCGISALRIDTKPFGESRPIADNNTKVGRQKNRRVTIRYHEPTETGPKE